MRQHLSERLAAELDLELVGVAETEAEAKDWIERNPHAWDVALVDLFLLEGSGAGVVRHCRSRMLKQPILVMTNYAVRPLLHHCKLLGASGVYEKSTELNELIAQCIGLAARKAKNNDEIDHLKL